MTDEFTMKHELRVSLIVESEGQQTINLTTEAPEQRGPWGADAVDFGQMLVDGLAAMCGVKPGPVMRPVEGGRIEIGPDGVQLQFHPTEYPGQPEKKDGVGLIQRGYPYADGDVTVLGPQVFVNSDKSVISYEGENYYCPALIDERMQNVDRLRATIERRTGVAVMPFAEILAILNGDAADDETMTQAEVDRRGMYGGDYTSIPQANRHAFPTMSGHAVCNRCEITRSQAYVQTNGRYCSGMMNVRPA